MTKDSKIPDQWTGAGGDTEGNGHDRGQEQAQDGADPTGNDNVLRGVQAAHPASETSNTKILR